MSYKLLFQKVYDLVKWIYPTINKFPRKQRLILSQRIEVTAIRILEMVIDLSERDTKTNRRKILYEIHKLQILLRLCKDLSYLSFGQYEFVSSLLLEISDLLKTGDSGQLAKVGGDLDMVYTNLYSKLCSFRNLELAYRKARKNKRAKKSVQEFGFDLERNLLELEHELETLTYKPRPLKQFVIRDPKTRLISASDFRDRVVHHALCNIIQPIFEKAFIYDSHANQINKGSSKAVERFDKFKRMVSENGRLINKPKDSNMVVGYVLKADIKHFFDSVGHDVLLKIIQRKIKDEKVIWLIRKILDNHGIKCKGMPIGNLTSQFFANLYLNELDCFVKHELKTKYYIRYVDDFILLDKSKERLKYCKEQINNFLKTIELELHPEKSNVYPLCNGIRFLGFRIFFFHRLLTKKNIRKIEKNIEEFKEGYKNGFVSLEDINRSLTGWMGYAQQANTHNLIIRLRKEIETF